ncbi:N-acetyltransferase ESCO2 isoform X2 [Hemicordylus capensis]|uniref:N-acetyltransferase ESCO2 isoform X2 n=1 Tax=Hemicordylus capensis TaxID=884348 RepID=UPI002302C22B|nr:N-acetyltransferase ESCO2 isoform X2 [Hemicordylus capensis]
MGETLLQISRTFLLPSLLFVSTGLQSVDGNLVKKLMMEFTEKRPAGKMLASDRLASPVKQMSSSRGEDKENQSLPQKSTRSQKFDVSPLQTASVPKEMQRAFPQKMSPESGITYTSIVPTSSFYSKGKAYQSPLERKLANESHPLGPRNEGGNLPIANKTETAQIMVMSARRINSKVSNRPAASRKTNTLPRNTKKAKMEMAPPKSVTGKENVKCAVEKKMEAPYRVLSMRFKPVLKLQTGAAFFASGKKWHSGSKKVLSIPPSPHNVSKPMVKEKQDIVLVHADLYLSTESRAGNSTKGSQKEEKHGHMEASEKVNHKTSQDMVITCESNLWQETGPLQTSHSGCSKAPARKETDTGAQGSETISQRSPRNMDKHENNEALHDDIHPLFSTPSGNKRRPRILPNEQPSQVECMPNVQKVTALLKTSKKTKELSKDLKGQMVIDAGQKHFGAVACKSCGMVYSAANPEDEAQHIQYHQRFLGRMKYVGWKNERVVAEFMAGKIVLILQDDPKYAIKKAEDVRELVDNELGFKQVVLTYPAQTQTYLFVSNERKIVGCLIAEPVRQAFRVLSEPPATLESPTKNSLEHHRAWCCSAKPEKVVCGISRIWVFSPMRRKGIASRLVDVVRHTFLFGSYLSTNEIAFSDPTPDGKLFATKYCQTPSFLVYNFISQGQFSATAK